jgi:hypothetical protein
MMRVTKIEDIEISDKDSLIEEMQMQCSPAGFQYDAG